MSTVTTIPVTITPDAEARVVELGMRSDLEHMLDHAREVIPGLRRLNVEFWEPEDFIDDPRITIEAIQRMLKSAPRGPSTPFRQSST